MAVGEIRECTASLYTKTYGSVGSGGASLCHSDHGKRLTSQKPSSKL